MEALNDDRLIKVAFIAELLKQQVQLVAAEQMYMLTLAGKEKALGLDHILGILYRDQGKLEEAEKMYQRALAGYEKAQGLDHTSTDNGGFLRNHCHRVPKPKSSVWTYTTLSTRSLNT